MTCYGNFSKQSVLFYCHGSIAGRLRKVLFHNKRKPGAKINVFTMYLLFFIFKKFVIYKVSPRLSIKSEFSTSLAGTEFFRYKYVTYILMISDFMLCFGLTVCILLLYILLQIFSFYVHSINTTMRLCTSEF